MNVEIVDYDGDYDFEVVPHDVWGTPHKMGVHTSDWLTVLQSVDAYLKDYNMVTVYTLTEDGERGMVYDNFIKGEEIK